MTGNSGLNRTTKCRTCLNSSKQLKSLKRGIIDRKQQKKSYGQLLKEVTNINIMDKKYRKMPQFICTYCLRKLKLAHTFVQQAHRAHDKLWYMLNKEQEAKKELECLQETHIDMKPCFKIETEEVDIEKLLEENLENGIQFEIIAKEELDIMDDESYMNLDATQIDVINPQNNDANEPYKPYACKHCEASYTTKYRLTYHLRKIHNIEANSKEITPTQIDPTPQNLQQYACVHCDSHYKTNVRLICHLKEKHNIVENFKDELQHDEQFEIEDQKELDSMDDKSMTNKNTSSVEINNSQAEENIGQERFYCEKCNSSYTKKFILNRHIRKKHQPKSKQTIKTNTGASNMEKIMGLPISFTGYRCTKCSLKFDTQLGLIQHFKHHACEKTCNSDQYDQTTPKTKEKPSIQKEKSCVPKEKNEVVKKENTYPSSGLSSSNLVDSEAKRFQCKLCEKSFDKSKQLSVHMRVHTFHRPFKCNECHKAYTKPWDLRIHQRKHTGEKPYTCGYCQMSFALTHSLKQHQKKCPNF